MINSNRITLAALLVGTCLLASEASADPTILEGDEQAARTSVADTIFYDNEFPILNVRELNGEAVVVEGPEIEDIFSYTSSATEVVVTIQPPHGGLIDVTTVSGPTWYEDSVGDWQATFPVPSPGNETSGIVTVSLDGSSGDDDDDDHPEGTIIVIRRDGP